MMQIINIQKEMFVVSLYLGFFMGVTYDIVRCFRRLISHNNLFISIEDIIFWCSWTLLIIDKIITYNSGALRGYVFLGLFLGGILYLCTISCIMMPIITRMLYFVRKCLKKLNKMLKNVVIRGKITLIVTIKKIRYGYEQTFKKKKIN